jgi:uncharacterized protein (DUF2147 family)
MKRLLFAAFLALFTMCMATAQSVVGTWKTIDDETNSAKSHIELTLSADGVLTGKVIKLLAKPETTVCDKCTGALKDKLVIGMDVLQNMKEKDGYYQGGTILDPTNGKTYKCKLWLKSGDGNTLEVRGSLGPFYRTQKWYRI